MANYNPYVRLERLSIDRFLSISHSSLEEQPKDKNGKRPRYAKPEEEIGKQKRFAKPKDENEKRPRFSKPEKETGSQTVLAKPEKKTGRQTRLAKQNSTYHFENSSEDTSSEVKEADLESTDSSEDTSSEVEEADLESTDSSEDTSSDTTFKKKSEKKKGKMQKVDSEKKKGKMQKVDSEKKKGIMQKVDQNSTHHFESSSEDTSSEVEESDLESYSNYSKEINPYSKSEKKKGKMQKVDVNELTEYEKLILKNKNEKHAFLDSLKINEVKESLSEAIKDYNKVGRKKWIPPPPPVPRLKIARSSKVDIDLSEKAVAARSLSKTRQALKAKQKKKLNKKLPAFLKLKDVLDSDQSYKCFLRDVKDLDQGNTKPIKCKKYESGLQDMKLLESRIASFSDIYNSAMDIHPMRENTIIAAGGQNGNLFLWNINSDSKPFAFQVHSRRIYQLKFNPENPHLIVSASADGTLREGDLMANVYNRVGDISDCSYFDFLSPETCLVAHRDGYVSVVDRRTRVDMRLTKTKNGTERVNHYRSYSYLRSVSVHPVNKNEYITPTSNGCVRLWDLRKRPHPVKEVQHPNHNKALHLHSAIFSPLTGKSVLTSSNDGRICMFDTSSWKTNPNCTFTIMRNRRCRATWQPRTDSNFAVVGKNFPRKIVIFNNKEKVFKYAHESLNQIIYFCSFHPSLPIMAAVGKTATYVFANEDHW